MARDNYSYKKYQKELAQKKKREEKLQNKLKKKNMQAEPAAAPHPAVSDGGYAASAAAPEQAPVMDEPVV